MCDAVRNAVSAFIKPAMNVERGDNPLCSAIGCAIWRDDTSPTARPVLLISSMFHHCILAADLASGEVSVFAGERNAKAYDSIPVSKQYVNGSLKESRFTYPGSICRNPSDNSVLVAEPLYGRIRKISRGTPRRHLKPSRNRTVRRALDLISVLCGLLYCLR